jgi:hypothetical protein
MNLPSLWLADRTPVHSFAHPAKASSAGMIALWCIDQT